MVRTMIPEDTILYSDWGKWSIQYIIKYETYKIYNKFLKDAHNDLCVDEKCSFLFLKGLYGGKK